MGLKEPKVAFSYDIFSAQHAGGVSRCMIEVMRGLDQLDFDWSLWAPKTANVMLQRAMAEHWATSHTTLAGASTIGRLRGTLRNEGRFANWVARVQPKVVHRTYYPIVNLIPRKVKQVETLHDLWDERLASAGDTSARMRSFVKRRACRLADAVICVSEHTKLDAINQWPELEDRISVIPHGVGPISLSPAPVNLSRPFFLFVGRREGYKNFEVAVSALAKSRLSEHILVCFGGGKFTAPEVKTLSDHGLGERVVQVAGSDDLLAGLYLRAVALLYPSSFEGFGMPILEAMVHGCPVIAAPLTSLPEVGGDAALYADPLFPDEWAEIMQTLAFDESLIILRRKMGRVRASKFSWNTAARKHAALYENICS